MLDTAYSRLLNYNDPMQMVLAVLLSCEPQHLEHARKVVSSDHIAEVFAADTTSSIDIESNIIACTLFYVAKDSQ